MKDYYYPQDAGACRYPVPIGGHELPPLPYAYNALEPVISERTLEIHYDRHHRSYVEGLNRAELTLAKIRQTGDDTNGNSSLKHWERELAFNGSGHILHSIFWATMTPRSTGQPGPETWRQMNKAFSNFEGFKQQLINTAVVVEASGWGVLVWNPAWGRLEVLTAEKHQNLTEWGSIPILVVDVWEHAYYLDYKNRRAEYVNAWWTLVDWAEVEYRLLLAMQTRVPLGCCREL